MTMRISGLTRQQAGECADALRKLMRDADVDVMDEEGEYHRFASMSYLQEVEQVRIRDLLLALEDAERGTPALMPVREHNSEGI